MSEVKCFGFFGSLKVAYFEENDKVGVRLSDWTREQRDAVQTFSERYDEGDCEKAWAIELVAEWDALNVDSITTTLLKAVPSGTQFNQLALYLGGQCFKTFRKVTLVQFDGATYAHAQDDERELFWQSDRTEDALLVSEGILRVFYRGGKYNKS